MSNKLIAENTQLRARLAQLIEQAERNEQIMRRHQMSDLKFIGANGLRELIECVFDTLTESSQLDVVTLALIDRDSEISRIMADLQLDAAEFPNLVFLSDLRNLGGLLQKLAQPVLGAFDASLYGSIFPTRVLTPNSIAVVPLIRHGSLLGCLGLGSLTLQRFTDGMATDFIEHLGSIVAICLENVLNNERLKRLGLTDSLTGVHNRRYLEQRLLEEINRTRRNDYLLSCLYIDIDHFKKINDSAGHQAGDEVLQEVAQRIKAELRLADALGRFGGEEFVVLLVDATLSHALAIAERIRASIAATPMQLTDGEIMQVTASIGVTELRTDDQPFSGEKILQRLLSRADSALYQAKKNGRNLVVSSHAA